MMGDLEQELGQIKQIFQRVPEDLKGVFAVKMLHLVASWFTPDGCKEALKDKKLPKREVQKTYSQDSAAYQFGSLLIGLVNKRMNTYERYMNDPEAVEILLQNQAHHMYKLLYKDKRSQEEVLDVLEWSQQDEFWKGNIRSASKLREQFKRLLNDMADVEDDNPELTKKIIGVYRALINNPSYKPSNHERSKFVLAGLRMTKFFSDETQRNVDPSRLPEYLLSCLEKRYADKGEPIFPGHLCSDHTWEILLPQYLLQIGV